MEVEGNVEDPPEKEDNTTGSDKLRGSWPSPPIGNKGR